MDRKIVLSAAVAVAAALATAGLVLGVRAGEKAQALSKRPAEQLLTPIVDVSGDYEGVPYTVRAYLKSVTDAGSFDGRYVCVEFKSPPGGGDDFNCYIESSFLAGGGIGFPALGAYVGATPSSTAQLDVVGQAGSESADLFGPFADQGLDFKIYVGFDQSNVGVGAPVATTRLVARDDAGAVLWEQDYRV